MIRRKFYFYFSLILRYYTTAAPGTLLHQIASRMSPVNTNRGIRIVDPLPDTRKLFTENVTAALDLIAETDLMRFRRVESEILTIMNTLATFGSVYNRPLKLCAINLRCFLSSDKEETVRFLASDLVRDATMGKLITRGILRCSRNADRFDRMCAKEARNFLNALGFSNTPWDDENLSSASPREFWKLAANDMALLVKKDLGASGRAHKNRFFRDFNG
jgi:hypothetical protein